VLECFSALVKIAVAFSALPGPQQAQVRLVDPLGTLNIPRFRVRSKKRVRQGGR